MMIWAVGNLRCPYVVFNSDLDCRKILLSIEGSECVLALLCTGYHCDGGGI